MPNNLTDSQARYQRFWQQFAKYLAGKGSKRSVNPKSTRYNYDMKIVDKDISVALTLVGRRDIIGVEICLINPNHNEFFNKLREDEHAIENALGLDLTWDECEGKQKARIVHEADFDPKDEADWQRQFSWFEETIEKFYEVFTPRLEETVAELGLG